MNSNLKNCGAVVVRAGAGKLQTKLSDLKANSGKYAKASLPALCLIGVNVALSQNIFAQGPIFTGDAGNLSNIIREIITYLAGNEVCKLFCTCQALYALYNHEEIWRELCARYRITNLDDFDLSQDDHLQGW